VLLVFFVPPAALPPELIEDDLSPPCVAVAPTPNVEAEVPPTAALPPVPAVAALPLGPLELPPLPIVEALCANAKPAAPASSVPVNNKVFIARIVVSYLFRLMVIVQSPEPEPATTLDPPELPLVATLLLVDPSDE
jgi:hypothetical protein